MKNNVGGTDAILRVIAGVIIVAIGVYYGSWWGLIGLVPLLTGFTRFCPLYRMIGINTCNTK